MAIKNLDFFRSLPAPPAGMAHEEIGPWLHGVVRDLGARMFEALSDIDSQMTNVAQQTNANRTGQPAAPPSVSGIQVSAQNGHFQVSVSDDSEMYRGVRYFIEHSDSPHFTNPHVVELGTTRNANLFLGGVTRYFRAYSAYPGSGPGQPVYFGGATPTAVKGGGSIGGPNFLSSQGSGTGDPGVGLQGPGAVPFRSATGAAPTR